MMIPAIAVLLMKGLQASWEIAWHTGRADRTVMGRGPSRSYQVTSHPAARATWRPTSPGMTPCGQSKDGSGPQAARRYSQSKEFREAGRRRLTGDTARAATSD